MRKLSPSEGQGLRESMAEPGLEPDVLAPASGPGGRAGSPGDPVLIGLMTTGAHCTQTLSQAWGQGQAPPCLIFENTT